MQKKELIKQVETVLKEVADQQTNLAAPQARSLLAEAIVSKILGKFYVVPYASQRDFE